MGVLSADHIKVFLTIVDEGSFSAAARALRRSQTAISYAIQNLEAQLGVGLFERDGRRPTLTSAGAALLVDAQKVTHSLQNLRARAEAIARGIEPELEISIDEYFPPDQLIAPLRDFAAAFPEVRMILQQVPIGIARDLVLHGKATIGIISHAMSLRQEFQQAIMPQKVRLMAVVAKDHPLASANRVLQSEELAGHVQIVSILHLDTEFGIFSPRLWHCSTLRIQRAAVLAGVGWSAMPEHMVQPDLLAGLIVPLRVGGLGDIDQTGFDFDVVHLSSALLGPAAKWLIKRLAPDSSSL